MTNIYLIRHAHAEEWPHDTAHAPLTEYGKKQAQAAAKRLGRVDAHVIYTSSYKRSHDTAKIIAKSKAKKIQKKDELLEVDFRVRKRLSLASFEELQNIYSKTEVEQINNLLKAQRRTIRWLKYVFDKHPDQNVFVVTHGNVIKATVLGVLELKLARFQKFVINEASITLISGNSQKDARIITLNEISHLRKKS